ncbi:MAG: hypothetical protein R3C15_07440 [Thermoleophilia bacterium]
MCFAVVGAGDHLDDREAEPAAAAAAGLVGAREPFEGVRDERAGDARALICDVQLD